MGFSKEGQTCNNIIAEECRQKIIEKQTPNLVQWLGTRCSYHNENNFKFYSLLRDAGPIESVQIISAEKFEKTQQLTRQQHSKISFGLVENAIMFASSVKIIKHFDDHFNIFNVLQTILWNTNTCILHVVSENNKRMLLELLQGC